MTEIEGWFAGGRTGRGGLGQGVVEERVKPGKRKS